MEFEVAGRVQDLLRDFGVHDQDGFAGRFAAHYIAERTMHSESGFTRTAMRVKTGSLRAAERGKIVRELVHRIDHEFFARLPGVQLPDVLAAEGRTQIDTVDALRTGSADAFHALLLEFAHAIERYAVDAFWESRRDGRLKKRPEAIAQAALSLFLHSKLAPNAGFVFQEVKSGIGSIDVLALIGETAYVAELKVVDRKPSGEMQLATYLGTQGLSHGWLVLFDARQPAGRSALPSDSIEVDGAAIHRVIVDINPSAPSSLG